MSYIIIAGGISVNDPQKHDQFPYNFINPSVAKAKALKGSGATDIIIALFVPPYETRVKKQVIEHSTVKLTKVPCAQVWWTWACEQGYIERPYDPAHFTRVASDFSAKAGATFTELRSETDLTTLLNKASTINSIYYFGHSDPVSMFLEYSVSVASKSTVMWGTGEAAGVAKSKFAAGAKFVSYGCNQGDSGGLAQLLSDKSLWGIRCIGSLGKTDFVTIGQNQSFPSSAGGWVSYTDGSLDAGAVDITKIV